MDTSGRFINYPKAGGLMDQDEFILDQMRYCFNTYQIWSRENKTPNDYRFMSWVNS